MGFSRYVTLPELMLIFVVALLMAGVRELMTKEDPRGSQAEARRIQDRMKAYQDEWKQSRRKQTPQDDENPK